MAKSVCKVCGQWFEDSELDEHLNQHTEEPEETHHSDGLREAVRLSLSLLSWLTNCCSHPHFGQMYRSIRIGPSPSSDRHPINRRVARSLFSILNGARMLGASKED